MSKLWVISNPICVFLNVADRRQGSRALKPNLRAAVSAHENKPYPESVGQFVYVTLSKAKRLSARSLRLAAPLRVAIIPVSPDVV